MHNLGSSRPIFVSIIQIEKDLADVAMMAGEGVCDISRRDSVGRVMGEQFDNQLLRLFERRRGREERRKAKAAMCGNQQAAPALPAGLLERSA